MKPIAIAIDPERDLVLERVVDVRPELVWRAWTTPEHLVKWFTPAPWTTVACEIDLRPGGIFKTVMRSPDGQDFPHLGTSLEVVPQTRLTVQPCGDAPGSGRHRRERVDQGAAIRLPMCRPWA